MTLEKHYSNCEKLKCNKCTDYENAIQFYKEHKIRW